MTTAYYNSPIGVIRVQGDADRIASVNFVDAAESVAEQTPEMVERCLKELDEYFAGTRTGFTVVTGQQGTEFQQKIWNALMDIPFGATTSYIEIARRTGDEGSVRAVGTANGRNRLAILVPCHRVVGSNGKLVGYAGGLKRKRWLLDHEAGVSGEVWKLFF